MSQSSLKEFNRLWLFKIFTYRSFKTGMYFIRTCFYYFKIFQWRVLYLKLNNDLKKALTLLILSL